MRLEVPRAAWLFSPSTDLAAFLLPAVIALALVPLAPVGGDLPLPGWVIAVLLVDVAHVWATLYRTYLDRELFARRRRIFVVVPLVAYAAGVALHHRSPGLFWSALAYTAVWHFVRQQYGWVALLHRKEEVSRLDRWIDRAAIYSATIGPLVWWHAHLPRPFEWFVAGDFVADLLPPIAGTTAMVISSSSLIVFVARQIVRVSRGEGVWLTKVVVVVSTFACWHVGIVVAASDWAFTVTNVLIHGVPYFVLVWIYGRRAPAEKGSITEWIFGGGRWLPYYLVLVGLAWMEEWGWDRLIWHDHGALFPGPEVAVGASWAAWLVPLLALPQATHYVLDAFIWRRADAR